jgi:hypothetical protein
MSHSSPEGIILGKGSRLISFDASINEEKVISIKQEPKYNDLAVKRLLVELRHDILIKGDVDLEEWWNQKENKNLL